MSPTPAPRPPHHPSPWAVPSNTWYAVAASRDVGRQPIARRALNRPIVLYRTTAGRVVALEDRCAHRPYPLSLGRLDGDRIVSGYTGFAYDVQGSCVSVPTQAHVPIGARVAAFPVHDDDAFVWVWLGTKALARLRPDPEAPWLVSPAWATFGDEWETAAALWVLQDNFADISHVAVVDEDIAPPALAGTPPPLEVEVSETSVLFWRNFPPAPVPTWHAEALGVSPDGRFAQREEGHFVAPGLWVDRWDVEVPQNAAGAESDTRTFRFTHAITPVDDRVTRHMWRVSRNFSLDQGTTDVLKPVFERYYRKVRQILQTIQTVVDRDGVRPDVNVSADAAGIAVRRIMRRLVADEAGGR
jgi:vanillate O-demethylase monooxygenase subunit